MIDNNLPRVSRARFSQAGRCRQRDHLLAGCGMTTISAEPTLALITSILWGGQARRVEELI